MPPMDRRFAKEARRRRYVIRVNAEAWFRTQVWVNGKIHRTTDCYGESDVRRLTRQFEREIADLVAVVQGTTRLGDEGNGLPRSEAG